MKWKGICAVKLTMFPSIVFPYTYALIWHSSYRSAYDPRVCSIAHSRNRHRMVSPEILHQCNRSISRRLFFRESSLYRSVDAMFGGKDDASSVQNRTSCCAWRWSLRVQVNAQSQSYTNEPEDVQRYIDTRDEVQTQVGDSRLSLFESDILEQFFCL